MQLQIEKEVSRNKVLEFFLHFNIAVKEVEKAYHGFRDIK